MILWDDFLVDEAKSTAECVMHRPVKKEKVITFNKPWEGDGCNFFNIVKANGEYRMYYNARGLMEKTAENAKVAVCCLRSVDGKNWERINVGEIEVGGSKENNIVKDSSEFPIDNFIVFYDENPACPEDERFKATAMVINPKDSRFVDLYAYYSADGIHFYRHHSMFGSQQFGGVYKESVLVFDSMNVAFWDTNKQKYVAYVRGFHGIKKTEREPGNDYDRNLGIRDVRYAESNDFIHWTEPKLLEFNTPDYPLYTNCVSMYEGMYIGFPTRYIERMAWNDSYEELTDKENRQKKMQAYGDQRIGLAMTQAIFMHSRDGLHFNRYDEAYISPGAETPYNWCYGDAYPSHGFIETDGDDYTYDKVLSIYFSEGPYSRMPVELYRYEIRKDGFVSRYGDYAGKKVVTKPFVLQGDKMYMNFATSPAGCVQVKITCGEMVAESQEHFGNRTRRFVKFDKDLSEFDGKDVTVEFFLKDAHIYSFDIE